MKCMKFLLGGYLCREPEEEGDVLGDQFGHHRLAHRLHQDLLLGQRRVLRRLVVWNNGNGFRSQTEVSIR